MKEIDKTARLCIVFNGLALLSEKPNIMMSRKDMFFVPRKYRKREHYKKAIKNSQWQKDCLGRMVSSGLLREVKRDSQLFYTPDNQKEMAGILSEPENFGGWNLAKYLFPSGAALSEEDIPQEIRAALMEEYAGVKTEAVSEEGTQRLKATVERMSREAEEEEEKPGDDLQSQFAISKELNERLLGVLDSVDEMMKSTLNRLKEMEGSLRALRKTLDKHVASTESTEKQERENRRKDATELLELFTVIGENQVRGTKIVQLLHDNVKKLEASIGTDKEVTTKVVQDIHEELKVLAGSYRMMTQAQTGNGRLQEAIGMIQRGLRDFEEGQALILEHQAGEQKDAQ